MSNLPSFNYDIDYSDIPSLLPPPPPSSVHGEIDEDDNQLPVDDSFHHRDAHYDTANDDDVHQRNAMAMVPTEALMSTQNDQLQPILPSPQQPELTLKEKLVLRERQQRIETERARLKRQFALSSTSEEIDRPNEGNGNANRNHDDFSQPAMEPLQDGIDAINGNEQEFEEESTRAYLDEEDAVADEANRRLGFNMERFLRNSDSFHPEFQNSLVADRTLHSGEIASDGTKGVVMERFLNDVVDNTNHMHTTGSEVPAEQIVEPHRSVSFDVEGTVTVQPLSQSVQLQTLDFQQESLWTSIHPSFGDDSAAGISLVSNASMRTEANTVQEEFFAASDPPLYSTSSLENMHETDRASLDDASSRVSDDEPRVLRLTEADMLEMAAIEEASIGNAPPSDRDDVESYSEIGELTDFGGSGGGMHRFLGDPTFLGPDTPTTALESASQVSQRSAHRGGASAVSSSATNEHTDVDIVTGHLDLIEGMPMAASDSAHYFVASASASVAANPPSEGGRDVDDDDETMDNESHLNYAEVAATPGDNDLPYPFTVNEISSGISNLPSSDVGSDTVGAADNYPVDAATVTNRQRRYNPNDSSVDGSRIENIEQDNVVDDFDFDKDEPLTPFSTRPTRGGGCNDDSFRNLPIDPWSPPGHMLMSPLHVGVVRGSPMVPADDKSNDMPTQNECTDEIIGLLKSADKNQHPNHSETTPLLLSSIPTLPHTESKSDDTMIAQRTVGDRNSSTFTRAIPDRQLALLASLVLEIPVFCIIMGGSNALCDIVGQRRYQLILSFLPVICAISGNSALQSREATFDAIARSIATLAGSHNWFIQETTTTLCHGIVMGVALGVIAYFVSGLDIIFGLTMLAVQLCSILSAGMTGILVSLLCRSTLKRETGQWSLLLVSACQDIVGSFATIVLSYYIIALLSAKDVEPGERCAVNVNP